MATRYGGKYSPDGGNDGQPVSSKPQKRIEVAPAGGRSNVLFIPAIVLVATSFNDGPWSLTFGLLGAGTLTLAALMLREGLKAEAAFNARKVARRPAWPRKMMASALTGVGAAFAVMAHLGDTSDVIAPLLYGLCAAGLHVAAFGIDPLKSKGVEGIDSLQQDRVARVVDEAEKHLAAMRDAILRANDRMATARLEDFQDTARQLIQTVEEDPRDLTAARKYLGVYLMGARDATVKFADIYARTRDPETRADYMALFDYLDQNFAARNRKSLLDDRTDLTVEIDVLRDRLSREGVRLD